MARFLKDNGLTLAFFGLFLICIGGQAISGYALQAEDPAGQSRSSGLIAYLADPSFLKGVFSNWQAALLQLLVLIVFSVFLRQRGASHSRKPDDEAGARHPGPGAPDQVGRPHSWTYANGLSLAFLALFLLAFAAFFFANAASYNADRSRRGEAALDLAQSLVSADLWFQTFQTWQAEFFAMGMFLLLSIYLRQDGSAESKRLTARNDETGAVNE